MKKNLTRFSGILAALLLLLGCNSQETSGKLTEYDLGMPEKFIVPESLLEISGICFHNGNSDTVYAIQDEQGKVYRLKWQEKKQYHAKFASGGDYEDLTIALGKVVVLKSNGHLYSFPFADAIYEEVDSVEVWKDLLPPGEYEGLYGDEASGKLYVICKNCPDDNSKNNVTGYILQLGDQPSNTGSFHIDVNEIKNFTGNVKRGFRPSAIAKSPLTSEWYILSAVNKLLVVADQNWKIKEVCQLDGNEFNQPEGVAFDRGGNLYISNEGDDLSQGNILKFIPAKKTK